MKKKPMQRKRGEPARKKPGPKPKRPPSTRVLDRLTTRDLLQRIDAELPELTEPRELLGEVVTRNARDVMAGYAAGELVIISRAMLRRIIQTLS